MGQVRRTRANPSPGGFRSLPETTRQPVTRSKKTPRQIPGNGLRYTDRSPSPDDEEIAALADLNPYIPPEERKISSADVPGLHEQMRKAAKAKKTSKSIALSTEHEKPEATTTRATRNRINTRSQTRSASPPNESTPQPTRKPARRARAQTNKRTRAQQSTIEETEPESDEHRPSKRARNVEAPTSQSDGTDFAEEHHEPSPSHKNTPAAKGQGGRDTFHSTAQDNAESQSQDSVVASTEHTVPGGFVQDDEAPVAKTPVARPQNDQQVFPRSADGRSRPAKTPLPKSRKMVSRTEPRNGKGRVEVRSAYPAGVNESQYNRYLADEWAQRHKRPVEELYRMPAKTMKCIFKVMLAEKASEPTRTFEEFLRATSEEPQPPANSLQELLVQATPQVTSIDEESEEEEYSRMLEQESPQPRHLTNGRNTHGSTKKGSKEIVKPPAPGQSTTALVQSASTSVSIPPAHIIDKETLLTDPDVLEAAYIVSQAFAADQSRRSKPFPNAEYLGAFLDHYQQEDSAEFPAIAAPKRSTSPESQANEAGETARFSSTPDKQPSVNPSKTPGANNSTMHPQMSSPENGDVSNISTESDTTPKVPQTQPHGSQSWLSSLTNTISSPLKLFSRGSRTAGNTPATKTPSASNLFAPGASGETSPTPTPRPASSKFGKNPTAGIKNAVKERNARAEQDLIDRSQVPIHLRDVMTSDQKAELKRAEDQEKADRHAEERRKKRAAAQEEDVLRDESWEEEYVCEKGLLWVAKWVHEDGKRRKIVERRLKNPSWAVPESSGSEDEDDSEEEIDSPSFSRAPVERTPIGQIQPPNARIFQQTRRAIGLPTPPSADEAEEPLQPERRSQSIEYDESFGDPHHARPYTGRLFGDNPNWTGKKQSRANLFTESREFKWGQPSEPSGSSGFRPPSSGSDSSSSSGSSSGNEGFEKSAVRGSSDSRTEMLAREKQQAEVQPETEDPALRPSKWTQSPPPKPKPSNAMLPGKQASENDPSSPSKPLYVDKFKPQKPSKLREVEQASPVPQKYNEFSIFAMTAQQSLDLDGMELDSEVLNMIQSLNDDAFPDVGLGVNEIGMDGSVERAIARLF
ncbi:hypothetical protein BP6252_10581 [Coleophoma cylindrospora]|uniref:Uncharacterized protein n=1 Tax=Coleophoma cylindrospora TaxID=1849047 RepID=A0A3D8QTD9_9HELO|nr:hypothetical protein BP6252_10581 [Coleophoma cylindrospora]